MRRIEMETRSRRGENRFYVPPRRHDDRERGISFRVKAAIFVSSLVVLFLFFSAFGPSQKRVRQRAEAKTLSDTHVDEDYQRYLALEQNDEIMEDKEDDYEVEQPVERRDKSQSGELERNRLAHTQNLSNEDLFDAPPTVLFVTPTSGWHGRGILEPATKAPGGCDVECYFTEDRTHSDSARALVYHVPGFGGPIPRARPGQVTVTYCMEPICYYPMLEDLSRQSDLEMSYRYSTADVWTPYYSDRIPWRERPVPFEEKMPDIEVHSFGRCAHTKDEQEGGGRGDKMALLRNYKFTLAFENCNAPDYVTEKIYHALRVGCVPVYMGGPNINMFVPNRTGVIDVHDFSSPRELADFLLEVGNDKKKYERFLEWKESPFSEQFESTLKIVHYDARCRLCRLLYDRRRAELVRGK